MSTIDSLLQAWSSTVGTGSARARSVPELVTLARAMTCKYADDNGSYSAGYELVPVHPDFAAAMRSISGDLDHKRISAWLARHRGTSAGGYVLRGTIVKKPKGAWWWIDRKEAAGDAATISRPYGAAGPAVDFGPWEY